MPEFISLSQFNIVLMFIKVPIPTWCHGVVDRLVTLNTSGTGSIPSHDTKVNSAFHPPENDK